jgi:hypothetical protein
MNAIPAAWMSDADQGWGKIRCSDSRIAWGFGDGSPRPEWSVSAPVSCGLADAPGLSAMGLRRPARPLPRPDPRSPRTTRPGTPRCRTFARQVQDVRPTARRRPERDARLPTGRRATRSFRTNQPWHSGSLARRSCVLPREPLRPGLNPTPQTGRSEPPHAPQLPRQKQERRLAREMLSHKRLAPRRLRRNERRNGQRNKPSPRRRPE